MAGVMTDWSKVRGAENLVTLLNKLKTEFDPENPQKNIPNLLTVYTTLNSIPDQTGLINDKIEEVKNLILACSGTWFEAYTTRPHIAVNTPFKVRIEAVSQMSGVSMSTQELQKYAEIDGEQIAVQGSQKSIELLPNRLANFELQKQVYTISQPYWLAQNHPVGMYKIPHQSHLLFPEGKPSATVKLGLRIGGIDIDFERPIVYKYTDQVRGEVYQPLAVTPSVTANLSTKAFVFNGEETKTISVKLKAFKDRAKGIINLQLPKGWQSMPNSINFELNKYGQETVVNFKVLATAKAINGDLKINGLLDGETLQKGIQEINYEHIPTITYFPSAEAKLVKLDFKSTAKNIGYIAGAGDLIPDMLKEVGFNVTLLSENEVMNGDLSVYDAIIAGVRAYNVNDRLKFEQEKLMQYVENGGVYMVQYNVNRPLIANQIGPYPFTISRDRVTDETSTVSFLKPESKALNYPNKITAKDFEGWVQERGLYFTANEDSRYEKPLGMSDSGEKMTDGALLLANYGKGKFVYTGLVFFRELPAGVPGAYRLFMNLISK
jgi:hypothetical protein